MDLRDGDRVVEKRALSSFDRVRKLVATPRCRSSAVCRSWVLGRTLQNRDRSDSCRLQERSNPWLCLRFQSDLAGAGRLAKRLGKIVHHRLHLPCHARFSLQSPPLRQQRFKARSVWVHSFHLHVSSLGRQKRGRACRDTYARGKVNGARKVNTNTESDQRRSAHVPPQE